MEKARFKTLREDIGKQITLSDWMKVSQERIQAFAESTEDRQWIHLDEERAVESPLKGTVAHGFLLLSLLPHLNRENTVFQKKYRMLINYGLNRVRFISPVHAGKRIRCRAVLKDVARKGFRKLLITIENTLEIEGEDKPALVAELLAMMVL